MISVLLSCLIVFLRISLMFIIIIIVIIDIVIFNYSIFFLWTLKSLFDKYG